MVAGKLNIEITAGNYFATTLRIEDVDLTGATLKMQMRDIITNESFDFVVADAVTRTTTLARIVASMSHTVTSGLKPGREYAYALQYTVNGEPQDIVEGLVTVKRDMVQ